MNIRTITFQKTYSKERRFFYAGVSLNLILFAGYIYFVSASVAHVVVRKELSQKVSETQTHISELESQYIAAQNAVSIDTALARGFEMNEKKVFVEKASVASVLSFNDPR